MNSIHPTTLFCALLLSFLISTAIAETERSTGAKSEFQYSHPCPSTGRTKGGCPGYVVDHIRPLACGGADEASNMQWQTVQEGKEKDRWELNCHVTKVPAQSKPGTTGCGGKTRCSEMADCAEARHYLNDCGQDQLDRDHDGIPCESLCR